MCDNKGHRDPRIDRRQGVGENEEVDDRGRWKIAVKMSFLSFPWSSASRGGEAGQVARLALLLILQHSRPPHCCHSARLDFSPIRALFHCQRGQSINKSRWSILRCLSDRNRCAMPSTSASTTTKAYLHVTARQPSRYSFISIHAGVGSSRPALHHLATYTSGLTYN